MEEIFQPYIQREELQFHGQLREFLEVLMGMFGFLRVFFCESLWVCFAFGESFFESLWECFVFRECFWRESMGLLRFWGLFFQSRFSLVSRDPFQEKNLEMLKKNSLSS